jgi:beta-lactamase class D
MKSKPNISSNILPNSVSLLEEELNDVIKETRFTDFLQQLVDYGNASIPTNT